MFADIIPDELRAEIERLGAGVPASLERFWRFAGGDEDRQPKQSSRFCYPGLPPRRWFDIAEHPEFRRAAGLLEEAHPTIKAEFEAFAAEHDELLTLYQNTGDARNLGWKAQYFYRDGAYAAEGFERFPRTGAALAEALRDVRYPLGELHFSILEPGATIKPHCDPQNFAISFHLAVITPPDCALDVSGDARPWVEGRCLLFDHSYEHQAWNRSPRRRVSLIADVWNPFLSEAERQAILLVFRWLYAESHG
jgi:hypothetical protein